MMGALLVGCQQQYYRVTVVQAGKKFYTKGWLDGMYGRSRQISFKELDAGHKVVLPSSHVEEVSQPHAVEATKEQDRN